MEEKKAIGCQTHRRKQNRRSRPYVASEKDNETNHEKSVRIPRMSRRGFYYGTLVVIALVFDHFPTSTCMTVKRGSLVRFQFHCGNHQYQNEHLHFVYKSKSRFLLEHRQQQHWKQKEFSWSISSSVTGLFEVLDEESGNGDDWDEDNLGIVGNPNSPDNGMEEDEENENMVSDAEALLACWSFLKRRKRLGRWNEYEERQAQNLLSRNYFLTDDEVGDIILEDDDDDDDDDDERETYNKSEINDDGVDFDNIIDDDSSDSITTVEDILSGSGPDNEDDVAKDMLTISSFMSSTDDPVTTEGVGIEKRIEKRSATEDINLWYTEFTSFPTEPNPSRTRRVDAMKRRWEDPDYRKRWHEKRWGSKSNHQRKKDMQQTDRERQAIQRARALPSGFLGSNELASMTEEEIADAIRTRMRSNRKRVAKRKQTLQRRKDVLAKQIEALETLSEEDDFPEEEDTLIREVLFSPTKEALEEGRQKRSERAKKLYATRLKNQELLKESQTDELSSSPSVSSPGTKSHTRNKGRYFPPKQLTPKDAFLRIENDLDHGKKPAVDDVNLVLEPRRMKNRKLLLRRILQDEFNLRGKCVPPIPSEGDEMGDDLNDIDGHDEHDLEFITHCTIERLGVFVVRLLKREYSS